MGALMKRNKRGKSRNKRSRGPCSFCGQIHPRGRNQKEKARKGLKPFEGWVPCRKKAIARGRAMREERRRPDHGADR